MRGAFLLCYKPQVVSHMKPRASLAATFLTKGKMLYLPKVRQYARAAPTLDAHIRPILEAFCLLRVV